MDTTLLLLNALLPLLYGTVVTAYALGFFRDVSFARKASRPLLLAVVFVHALTLALRTAAYRHPPLASIHEVLTSIALAVAVVYLYVEYGLRSRETGMFVLAVSFVFQAVSSAFIAARSDLPEVLRSPFFGVHTGSAVLGYTAFAVSAIYGILYLSLYHDLKARRFGAIYRRLPPLEVLVRMSVRAATFGLVCLAFTIGFGVLWALREVPRFYLDPKFSLSLVAWGVYAIAVGLYGSSAFRARRTIYLFLFGFSLMLASAAAASFGLTSFHGFV